MCVTWLIMCGMTHCVIWLVHVGLMCGCYEHLCVWERVFVCVCTCMCVRVSILLYGCTRLRSSSTCVVTHPCVPWLIYSCDMTHSYMWHDSFICVTLLIHMCHDSSICVITDPWLPWFIHMCHDSFIRVMTHPRVQSWITAFRELFVKRHGPVFVSLSLSLSLFRPLLSLFPPFSRSVVPSLSLSSPSPSFSCLSLFLVFLLRILTLVREVGGWGRVPFSRI